MPRREQVRDREAAALDVVDRHRRGGSVRVAAVEQDEGHVEAAQFRQPFLGGVDGGQDDPGDPLLAQDLEVAALAGEVLGAAAQQEGVPAGLGGEFAPRASSVKNGFAMSSTTRARKRLRPIRSCRADSLRTYPSSSMASCTRRRLVSVTVSGRLRTLLTVPMETPARAATSLMLTAATGRC